MNCPLGAPRHVGLRQHIIRLSVLTLQNSLFLVLELSNILFVQLGTEV